MDLPTTSISDAEHYKASAKIRLRCASLILDTFEKLRGKQIGSGDRILDLGCGRLEMLNPLWLDGVRKPDYVLGLDADYGEEISQDIRGEESRWSLFENQEPTDNPREFIRTPALEWDPPQDEKAKFSVVYSGSAFHWIVGGKANTDRESCSAINGKPLFETISAALQPGGWLVAHSPGCENFYPVYTRLIIAALNEISKQLGAHPNAEVNTLASLPDIREWVSRKPAPVDRDNIERAETFAMYWRFRRGAKVGFWKGYDEIRKDFKNTGLSERLLYRGLDWELAPVDKFYSHWASAGKFVFWSRFQTYEEREQYKCALYAEFETAFKNILNDDSKLEALEINTVSINGKKYLRHYCHRYYIILQKTPAELSQPRETISGSALTSLPIKVAYDVATNDAPVFTAKTNDKVLVSDSVKGWDIPFRTISDCVPKSMVYGMYFREGRGVLPGTVDLPNTDRRALLLRGTGESVPHAWQYKVGAINTAKEPLAIFTSVETISSQGLPVCLIQDEESSIPNRLLAMTSYVRSQAPELRKKATPVFIVASATKPISTGIPPSSIDEYRSLLNGATQDEVENIVSFLFYSSESIFDWIRELENGDVTASSIYRTLRWHATVAFPSAFILGHTTPTAVVDHPNANSLQPEVQHASASVLLDLTDTNGDDVLSFADFALIGASLRILSMWDRVAAERALRRRIADASQQSAQAAIMSRNLSHNMGSHALANPKLYDALGLTKDVAGARGQLSIFHQYIQNRLDFIARALNPISERPEPLFFINDVMNGLFRQAVLLETLLEDRGFHATRNPIRFHVSTKTSASDGSDKTGIYALREADLQTGPAKELPRFRVEDYGDEPTDVLVGITGGVIGCQALYSFIENLIRNAAKYGEHCNGENHKSLEVYLDLRAAERCETEDHECFFVLEVWENLSHDSTGTDVKNIRQLLNQNLIDDHGHTVSKGQGLQEMKIAARFLSGNHLFKSDESCNRQAADEASCKHDRYCKFMLDPNYNSSDQDSSSKSRVNSKQPLRCFVTKRKVGPNDSVQDSIVYQLLVPKALLAGVVAQDLDKYTKYKETDSVLRCGTVPELARMGAAFGIILDHDGWSIEDTVKQISSFHNALPFRLIVLTADEARREAWNKSLSVTSDAGDNPTRQLPVRRVHVVQSQELHGIFARASVPGKAFLGANGWDAALLMLYHAWMVAFKGIPDGGSWKIVIGFERTKDQVQQRWKAPLGRFTKICQTNFQVTAEGVSAPLTVEVHLCGKSKKSKNADNKSKTCWDSWDGLASCGAESFSKGDFGKTYSKFAKRQPFVVFDNHGEAIDLPRTLWLGDGLCCYQSFSGSEQVSLFQSLESPPQTPFSFAYFIYSLLESSLINVVVVDERVAGASLAADVLRQLTRARVFPVFSLTAPNSEEGKQTKVRLDPKMQDVWKYRQSQCEAESVQLVLPAKMSFVLQKGNNDMIVCQPGENVTSSQPVGQIDVVIVHEGVVDTVFGKSPVWPAPNTEQAFFSFAPRVIRTSGRGSQERHLSSSLPFMEFSELSETTYRSLNKLSLGKAVTGVSGKERDV